ncbi:MAG: hypothetical protein E2590_14120 [Chryseobacterium sp.]|nr:hypothetical protein [Chryseobacterium sp.]
MKLMFVFILSVFSFFQTDLEALRSSYAVANLSKENAEKFIKTAEKKTSSGPIISAYKAAAKILEAKITSGIGKKKALVKTGALSLEEIIRNNPNNSELRVIRMSVQENIPKVVGYSKNLKEDKAFLISNYNKQNEELKNYIKEFASQSKTFSNTEKAILK